MTAVPTFTATIYCGLRRGYDGDLHDWRDAKRLARAYCDEAGLGLTVTNTWLVYKGGDEPGVSIGLINYPRFSSTAAAIRNHALTLAERLRRAPGQHRVSVVFPDETVMLGDDETTSVPPADPGADEVPDVTVRAETVDRDGRMPLPELLVLLGLTMCMSEARRVIAQGGVTIGGCVADNPAYAVPVRDGLVVKVGKSKAARVRLVSELEWRNRQ